MASPPGVTESRVPDPRLSSSGRANPRAPRAGARSANASQPAQGTRFARFVPTLSGWARTLVRPDAGLDVNLSSSATINAQIWFNEFPLRPTAGWAVVSAILAYGFLTRRLALDWGEVALLLLLVDPLWGSIWRLAAGRTELLPLRERDVRRRVWLPYLQPGSPASRLFGWDDTGIVHLLFRVGLPTLLLTLAIAFVLGTTAVLLTFVLIAVSVAGWIVRHTLDTKSAMLHSVVTIVLPWSLALSHLGLTQSHEKWLSYLAMVGLWFLHNWGEGRTIRYGGDWLGIALLGMADVGIGLLMVMARAPLWLALLSVLWLPTWLSVYLQRPMQRLNFWWLLAMLVSGMALGQSVM